MKTLLQILSLLTLFFTSNSIVFSQNYEENKWFTFTSYINEQFYPGENPYIKLRVYSDDYYKGEEKTLDFQFKVYSITEPDSFYLAQNDMNYIDALGKDSISLLKYCKEVRSFSKLLNFKFSGYRANLKDSVDLGILPKGAYFVKVTGGYSVSYAGFIISSLGLVTKSGGNSFLAYIAESYSGKPISNAEVKLYYDRKLLASGKTNTGSLFLLSDHIDTVISNNSPMILIGKSYDDIIISDPSKFFGSYSQKTTGYIFTNQPVYRTKSTVYFKGTLTEIGYNSLTSFSDKKIAVIIQGPRNTEVFNDTLVTNSNGSFNGEVFIKDEYPIGEYSINVYHKEKSTGYGNFEIEQYKKPEYSVNVQTEKVRYSGDNVLKATVSADYFFGSPVTNAEVTYSIFKSTYYKPWWSFSRYSWWYSTSNYYNLRGIGWWYSNEKIYEGTGKLDDKGKLEIEYQLNEDFKESYTNYYGDITSYDSDYKYLIVADVVERSRRSINGSSSAFVTRGEYYINSKTSKYFYKKNDRAYLDIGSYNFEDRPVKADFEIKIYKYTYQGGENKRDFVKSLSGRTDETGKGKLSFPIDSRFTDGYYTAEIISRDSKGKKISTSNNFSVYTSRPVWYWESNSNDVSIITDKDEYFYGDTCRAFISIPDSNTYALITAEAGDIIYSSVEEFTGSTNYIEFVLDSNFSTNFNLSVDYINKKQHHSGSQQVIFIPEEKFLNVEIDPSNDIYRPGDSGNVKIKVTDHFGEPVKNAEVSLGVIDESIYYVKPDEVTDIRLAFYQSRAGINSSSFDMDIQGRYSSRYRTIFDNYDLSGKYDEDLVTIRGILLDEYDQPLPSTNIVLNNNLIAAVTDNFGYFMYRIPSGMYSVGIKNEKLEVVSLTTQSVVEGVSQNIILYSDKEMNTDNERIQRMKNLYDVGKYSTGSIGGKIMDITDRSPLSGAYVKIDGTNVSAITDENGEFIIVGLKEGNYDVLVSYIGYDDVKIKDLKVPLDGIARFELLLSSSTEVQTDVIEITADRTKIDLEQSGRLLTQEQIEQNGIRGIGNIVSKTNGVVSDEGGQNINIRGSRTNETQIIIDGVSTAFVPGELLSFITPSVRKDFRDAIYWAPYITTDENGYANATIKYPDNLTTWRFTSRVITNDRKVGEQRTKVITKKDLLIRAEAPRFFRESDEVTITTIIHNYLATSKKVKVLVKGENLFVKDNTEKYIDVKPNSDVSIDWNVRVLDTYGNAKLYAEALTDEESDAMEVLLPLEPKGLRELEANQFSISDQYASKDKSFTIPYDAESNTAGLTLSVSPSLASVLFTSLEYLIGYPYGCTEQTISRFIPLIVMAGAYDSLGLSLNENIKRQIPDMVERGLLRLKQLQHYDGGWGWWTNDEFDPMMSAYVVTGLSLARDQGYSVDKAMFKGATSKLYKYLSSIDDRYERMNIIYALSIADKEKADSLDHIMNEILREDINSYELSLAALSFYNIGMGEQARDVLSRLQTKRSILDEMVYWENNPEEEYDLRTDKVLTTSFVLKAYMKIDPESDLVDKIVDWLIFQKNGTYWRNTRVTSGVVNALADYLMVSDELKPDYNIGITVNGNKVLDKHISRDDLSQPAQNVYIAGKDLRNGVNDIKIDKSGEGKLYFSSMATYYNTSYIVKEGYNGITVKREYYKLVQKKNENGSFVFEKKRLQVESVTSGDIILVKTFVDLPTDDLRYFMIEDPIPAGCEVLNDEDTQLYNIVDENSYNGREYYGWRWWYSDKEIRDNKVVFFTTRFYGRNEFSYLMRAQIPGEYYVNPSQASLMYYPKINGNSGNFVLKIMDKNKK